jgi:hypothetical protein
MSQKRNQTKVTASSSDSESGSENESDESGSDTKESDESGSDFNETNCEAEPVLEDLSVDSIVSTCEALWLS